jgi:hypothetical protein
MGETSIIMIALFSLTAEDITGLWALWPSSGISTSCQSNVSNSYCEARVGLLKQYDPYIYTRNKVYTRAYFKGYRP